MHLSFLKDRTDISLVQHILEIFWRKLKQFWTQCTTRIKFLQNYEYPGLCFSRRE